MLPQSRYLDTVGVLARNLPDLALISDVLLTYDARDPEDLFDNDSCLCVVS